MKEINKYVTFYSPGTLFSESNTKKVKDFNLKTICKLAKDIKQRHGATPYGFVMEEIEEGKIKDGGDTYEYKPKSKFRSGTHFITGTVKTLLIMLKIAYCVLI